MKEFFIANIGNIVVILIVIAIIVIGLVLGKKTFVKAFIRSLVVEAERLYGSKTGKIKREAVFGWVYKQAPLLALFLPPNKLDALIKDAVEWLKKQLESPGVNLMSYADEKNAEFISKYTKPPDGK
jgi:hypothetical protein